MSRISLRGVLDESFLRRFAGLSQSSSGTSTAQALTGQGGGENQIASGLRFGARTFATAVSGLNTVITFLNVSQATLGSLEKLTDKLITLATEASLSTTGTSKRQDLNRKFHEISNDFQEIVEGAKLGETEFLTREGLSELFTKFGLDKESSDSIAAVFDEFVTPREDDVFASEEIKADRPVPIPPGAYNVPVPVSRVSTEFEKLFDNESNILTRPNAYRMLADLKALKGQIGDNVKALDNATQVVQANIELVRSAGLAFLEIGEQLTGEEEAEAVAEDLRKRIRKNAPAALAQAENLESIVVAALALDLDSLS